MFRYFALFLFTISPAQADDWTRGDTSREAIYLTLHTIDWLQTRTLAKNGWDNNTRMELNPLLGKQPSVGKLNIHYVITSLGHAYVASILPEDYRIAWQYLAIGDAGSAAWNNYNIGVRIKF